MSVAQMTPKRAVRLAVANIRSEGFDDVLRVPLEVNLIRKNPDVQQRLSEDARQKIESYLQSTRSRKGSFAAFEQLRLMPLSHVLVPKKEAFDFRKVAIIRPQDLVLYLAVAIMIADPFEKARSRFASGRVFSYRFKPILGKGQLFRPEHNFRAFQARTEQLSKQESFNYIVKGDIANFYDRVNLHRLESTLLTTRGLNSGVASLINQMLLHWAKRDSYGLPIGTNASRVLAEVALLNVDKALSEANLKYIRFVDDYRIFTKSATEAHSALARLMELLDREGLFINSRKSSIKRLEKPRPDTVPAKAQVKREDKARHSSFRIVAGYGGVIPIRFRAPSQRAEARFLRVDLDLLASEIRENDFAYPEQLRDLLQGVVAQERYDNLLSMCKLVDKFPQFFPMLVDLLIKKADVIPQETKSKISAYISSKIMAKEFLPEFLKASLINLIGSSRYFDRHTLMYVIRNLPWNTGAYLGRTVLDAAQNLTERVDALEVRSYFDRSNEWERRRIIRLMSHALPNAEYKAWRRAIRSYISEDPLAQAMK